MVVSIVVQLPARTGTLRAASAAESPQAGMVVRTTRTPASPRLRSITARHLVLGIVRVRRNGRGERVASVTMMDGRFLRGAAVQVGLENGIEQPIIVEYGGP